MKIEYFIIVFAWVYNCTDKLLSDLAGGLAWVTRSSLIEKMQSNISIHEKAISAVSFPLEKKLWYNWNGGKRWLYKKS